MTEFRNHRGTRRSTHPRLGRRSPYEKDRDAKVSPPRGIERLAQESYPQVALLKQVKGVGTLIALTFLLMGELTALEAATIKLFTKILKNY